VNPGISTVLPDLLYPLVLCRLLAQPLSPREVRVLAKPCSTCPASTAGRSETETVLNLGAPDVVVLVGPIPLLGLDIVAVIHGKQPDCLDLYPVLFRPAPPVRVSHACVADTPGLSVLLLWWAVLLGLSSLARYESAAWTAAIDLDASQLAADLRTVLDIAAARVPARILDSLHAA
jgi:YaaC-like Protein